MPSSSDELQRLHPTSLVFTVGAAAKGLLLPGLALLFASRGSHYEIWLMAMFVPAVIAALVKYYTYSYRLGSEEMVIREGVLTRNERHIPYGRVQNIDLIQNPVHRLFRVAEVRLQTASGDKPEAEIRVLSLAAIAVLRSHVFEGRQAQREAVAAETHTGDEPLEAAAAVPPAETLLHLPTRELVLFGLISNRGMAVIAAAVGLFFQMDPVGSDDIMRFVQLDKLEGKLALPGPLVTGLAIAGLFLVGIALLRLFSVIWAIVKFHGFTLTRQGDDLRAEYGLLTRVTATIPRHRIQLVSLRSRPLYRWFDRTAIQVETAGGAKGGEGGGRDRQWLAPLIPTGDAAALVERVLDEVDLDGAEWQPIAPRARLRILRRTIFVVALLALAAGFSASRTVANGWWWALPVAVLGGILAWIHARNYVKHAGWVLDKRAVGYRSGWWQRRTSFVLFSKMQAVAMRASPFDRRNAMATVSVDTAGAGRVGHGVDIRYLEDGIARGIRDRLGLEAERAEFRW